MVIPNKYHKNPKVLKIQLFNILPRRGGGGGGMCPLPPAHVSDKKG